MREKALLGKLSTDEVEGLKIFSNKGRKVREDAIMMEMPSPICVHKKLNMLDVKSSREVVVYACVRRQLMMIALSPPSLADQCHWRPQDSEIHPRYAQYVTHIMLIPNKRYSPILFL